jgi:hypothetical protein
MAVNILAHSNMIFMSDGHSFAPFSVVCGAPPSDSFDHMPLDAKSETIDD